MAPVPVVRAIEKFRLTLDNIRKKSYPAPVALMEMLTAHWLSSALIVAAELDIAGHLRDGAQPVESLAEKTQSHTDALYRVLRTLAATGIFEEHDGRTFALNDAARPLLADDPGSIRGMCLMNGRAFHWDAWGELRHAVRTGQSVVEHQQGKTLFEHLSSNPNDADAFNGAMTGWASQAAAAVARALDFSRFGLIADIGGGHGLFLGTILRETPTSGGLLFDQPSVVEGAGPTLRKQGVATRVRIEGGSFFERVPEGADAYLMKNILHDWGDEKSVEILKIVRKSMRPEARLLIVESVIPEQSGEYHIGKLIDLEMLVFTDGGKERTRREFEALFAASGFELVKIHPTIAIESIVEARPI